MSSKIKALLLVENNPYPSDFRVRREAMALLENGYDVKVIAPRGAGQAWWENVEGVLVYRFPPPLGGEGIIGYAFEFAYATFAMLLLTIWVALRHGVNVIHAANPPDTLFAIGIVFKIFGVKYIFDQHDLAPEVYLSRFTQPRENLIYKILCFLEKLSYATADAVIVTNESYKQVALNRGEKKPDKVFIVRNGPPLSYQPVTPDSELKGRAKYLIGYVGTIGPQDGLDYWMRAIREMVFTFGRRDFIAIVIGNGDAFADVKALAKELHVEDYVLFTGRLSELESRKYLSAVNVCVQPDPLSPLNDKSTMNKLMEYMALEKPTVAFDLVETRYSAQEAAVYIKPNDEHAFAEKVCWLLDNPDECAKMGKIGRERVATTLAWEFSIPEIIKAYSQGLGLNQSIKSSK